MSTSETVYLSIDAKGPADSACRPGDISLRLSNGNSLGHVQALTWHAEVGQMPRCTLQTILNAAEIKVLLEDVRIEVILNHRFDPAKVLWSYLVYRYLRRPFSRLFS